MHAVMEASRDSGYCFVLTASYLIFMAIVMQIDGAKHFVVDDKNFEDDFAGDTFCFVRSLRAEIGAREELNGNDLKGDLSTF
ncbi:hypothetical protein CEXT_667451 [Caerostris extrusa]|uniref:Uncharacterized protein n=1 Tax=Caerostris extrusa TaxID=172846 RepID=A0AAV4RS76_CAEEX|nr:hypothetical protein CEXT_667451 [Caerostris extrusa]